MHPPCTAVRPHAMFLHLNSVLLRQAVCMRKFLAAYWAAKQAMVGWPSLLSIRHGD